MTDVRRVSTAEAAQLCSCGYVYVDVRTEDEYAGGHAAGAFNVPYAVPGDAGFMPNDDFLPTLLGAFSLDAKLIVGCATGVRSAKACALLLANGFRDVVEHSGGWLGRRDAFGRLLEPGWLAAGLPTEAVTPGGAYAEVAKRRA